VDVRLGILNLVGLAVAVAFAVPMAGFGLSLLVDGRPLGAAFLVLAGLFLLGKHVLTTPTDLRERLLGRLVGGAVDPDADEESR